MHKEKCTMNCGSAVEVNTGFARGIAVDTLIMTRVVRSLEWKSSSVMHFRLSSTRHPAAELEKPKLVVRSKPSKQLALSNQKAYSALVVAGWGKFQGGSPTGNVGRPGSRCSARRIANYRKLVCASQRFEKEMPASDCESEGRREMCRRAGSGRGRGRAQFFPPSPARRLETVYCQVYSNFPRS